MSRIPCLVHSEDDENYLCRDKFEQVTSGVTLLVSERLSDSIISELSDDTLSSSGGIRFSQCETFVVV